jgi:hypothetical protein
MVSNWLIQQAERELKFTVTDSADNRVLVTKGTNDHTTGSKFAHDFEQYLTNISLMACKVVRTSFSSEETQSLTIEGGVPPGTLLGAGAFPQSLSFARHPCNTSRIARSLPTKTQPTLSGSSFNSLAQRVLINCVCGRMPFKHSTRYPWTRICFKLNRPLDPPWDRPKVRRSSLSEFFWCFSVGFSRVAVVGVNSLELLISSEGMSLLLIIWSLVACEFLEQTERDNKFECQDGYILPGLCHSPVDRFPLAWIYAGLSTQRPLAGCTSYS